MQSFTFTRGNRIIVDLGFPGTSTEFKLDKDLPDGLQLCPNRGIVYGNATKNSALTLYTIKSNDGYKTFDLVIHSPESNQFAILVVVTVALILLTFYLLEKKLR